MDLAFRLDDDDDDDDAIRCDGEDEDDADDDLVVVVEKRSMRPNGFARLTVGAGVTNADVNVNVNVNVNMGCSNAVMVRRRTILREAAFIFVGFGNE